MDVFQCTRGAHHATCLELPKVSSNLVGMPTTLHHGDHDFSGGTTKNYKFVIYPDMATANAAVASTYGFCYVLTTASGLPGLFFNSDGVTWQSVGGKGAKGDAGPAGTSVLYGTGAPGSGVGSDGDFYIDTTGYTIYGPKATGAWPSGTSLVGPAGTSILSGAAAPTTEGDNGDFYIRTTTSMLYGPKAAGTWPAGVSLIGATGPTGATGATGANGKTILNGTSVPGAGIGTDGDFYLDTNTSTLYGPKASGTWPSGVSLLGSIGPQGSAGADGKDMYWGIDAGAPMTRTVVSAGSLSTGPIFPVLLTAGTGYTVNDTLTVVGGTGTAATIRVDAVTGGAITGYTQLTWGQYSVSPTSPVSVTGGTGSNATFSLTNYGHWFSLDSTSATMYRWNFQDSQWVPLVTGGHYIDHSTNLVYEIVPYGTAYPYGWKYTVTSLNGKRNVPTTLITSVSTVSSDANLPKAVGVNSTSGPFSLYLKTPEVYEGEGHQLIVKDTTGQCGVNTVTLYPDTYVTSATLGAGGTGYVIGDLLTLVGGTGTPAVIRVRTVTGGVVSTYSIETQGSYTVSPSGSCATTGGSGASATFTPTTSAVVIDNAATSLINTAYGSRLLEFRTLGTVRGWWILAQK